MAKSPTKIVRIVKYMGSSGGFSTKDTERYRVELVGVKGQVMVMTGAWGTDRTSADKMAEDWVNFTGWSTFRVEEVKTVSTSYKDLK